MKLEEGKAYDFINIKSITLPGGDANLMLAGPDGKKYLLPLHHYDEYGLPDKSGIRCKVDKINCSGKVFLEPEHPFYKEGESYLFTIVSELPPVDERTDERVIRVRDDEDRVFILPASLLKEHPASERKTRLRIERITKGKIIFNPQRKRDDLTDFEEGKSYSFRVDRIITAPDYEAYYVVIDIHGREHLLNKRYYSHYGFKPGNEFTGKVIRYGAGRGKSIEPQNPWYTPGDIIEVTVSSSVEASSGEGYLSEVFDANGFRHSILSSSPPGKSFVRCKVVKLKKGRPVLEFVTH